MACALFESPVGFPGEHLRVATNMMVTDVQNIQPRCNLEDVAPGTYALADVHDDNMNGRLDTTWVGIPTEGYGFSNGVKALVGARSFSSASFPYDGRILDPTISLQY